MVLQLCAKLAPPSPAPLFPTPALLFPVSDITGNSLTPEPRSKSSFPDPWAPHRCPPPCLSPPLGPPAAARLQSASGAPQHPLPRLQTLPPSAFLPHFGKPAIGPAPGTLPAACCIAARSSLGEGGAEPAVTPKVGWAAPPRLPPAPWRARRMQVSGAGKENQNRRLRRSQTKKNKQTGPRSPWVCLPLLTFRAQKSGPGSPLVALGGATDARLVSEELRLS